jgi:hypothetical protein
MGATKLANFNVEAAIPEFPIDLHGQTCRVLLTEHCTPPAGTDIPNTPLAPALNG